MKVVGQVCGSRRLGLDAVVGDACFSEGSQDSKLLFCALFSDADPFLEELEEFALGLGPSVASLLTLDEVCDADDDFVYAFRRRWEHLDLVQRLLGDAVHGLLYIFN